MFRGKKYQESAKLIDRSVQYDPAEALDLVVKGASAKFDEAGRRFSLHYDTNGKRQRCQHGSFA